MQFTCRLWEDDEYVYKKNMQIAYRSDGGGDGVSVSWSKIVWVGM